ncbi:hypothetical protein Naga_100050g31 [Nannochloropsis gaditana]|uniref:Uncharacterized protein n=1 Tax=Nannochloropsis gaditana TaxID=72520 RepID=W7TR21_9STRA|nr:hypothetical protein Naga_100050g31 [Nannochloropsis gaditana]EWM29650.1 hypothetical protein Naga_100050g31 [Nannochloropsis gaditana]
MRKKGQTRGEDASENDEAQALAEIMMPRKHRRAYQVARRGEAKQKEKVEALVTKRRKLEEAAGVAAPRYATSKRRAGARGTTAVGKGGRGAKTGARVSTR